MEKKELIIVWILGTIMSIELVALLSLVYFTKLPFFLFIFTVTLRLLSFFFLGATALFSIFVLLGIKLEFTLEAWKNHLKESLRFLGSSFILTFTMIIACVLLGALIWLLLKKVYLLPTPRAMLDSIRRWVAAQFY
jgi:hypothetical protein